MGGLIRGGTDRPERYVTLPEFTSAVRVTRAGVAALTYSSATQTADVNILFPVGSFTANPVVTVTPTDERFTLAIVAVSTTSVIVRGRYLLGNVAAGFSMGIHWIAVQP